VLVSIAIFLVSLTTRPALRETTTMRGRVSA
jgi:hypothetical protein